MRIFSTALLLVFLFIQSLVSAQSLSNYKSYQLTGDSLIVNANNGSLLIQLFTSTMIKVSLLTSGVQNLDTSYSVIGVPVYRNPVFIDNTSFLTFSTDSVTIVINKNPLRLRFIFNNDTILKDENGLFINGGQTGVSFNLKPGEQVYGSGSRAIPINRRGYSFTMVNTAVGGYGYNTPVMNINIPFITSSSLYGLYFDNYSEGTLDIGNTDTSVLTYTSPSGTFSYFFIAGNSFANILESYTYLTGRQPLPPRWAMGYIQSKYGYHSESEAQGIVSQMRGAGFPMDGLVLDLYWYGGESLMGNLTWDNSAFPTPISMMHSFDSMGIKTILIAEPYVTQQSTNYSSLNSQKLFATKNGGNTYVINNFWAGSAALLDIFKPQAQQWMWTFYKARTDEGVGGWWSDLGEPEDHPSDMIHVLGQAPVVHNIYSLFWEQLLYNNYKTTYPNTRLFSLTRSGYAGMQRYGATPWSGDVQSTFSGLKAQIPIMLGMGMSGESYSHSDLGGFTGGSENDELYTRWFEYCTFVPIMRAHGENEPVEPVDYPSNIQTILHTYANLRYQLLPYNYSLAFQNSQTGLPQARQLNFFNPSNTALGNVNDEYYWGNEILVAPVITQGATSRSVVFPPGEWINYWDNSVNTGGSTATISAPLNTLPVFIKAGSFIPVAPFKLSTQFYKADSFYVNYYADSLYPESSYTQYDDDGQTPDVNNTGSYALIQYNGNVLPGETDIAISQTGNGYTGMPLMRQMIFELPRSKRTPTEVLRDGLSLYKASSLANFSAIDSAWYYDATAKVIYVHFKWNEANSQVRIIYGSTADIATINNEKLNVFPNPADDILNIQPANCNAAPISNIQIYSIDGEMVMNGLPNNNNPCLYNVNIAWLVPGVYLVKTQAGGEVSYAKFVKQ